MARGKMVQEPFLFDSVVVQNYALAYVVGELHAEFVDKTEDTIATTMNTLVWDTESDAALKEWGQEQIRIIARQWSDKRKQDNLKRLSANPSYLKVIQASEGNKNTRGFKMADRPVRQVINQDPNKEPLDFEPVIESVLTFLEFNAFEQIAEEVINAGIDDISKLIQLFNEWQIVEAKDLARVTQGRIQTIEKLDDPIKTNALEVTTLHQFLKEFPWVIALPMDTHLGRNPDTVIFSVTSSLKATTSLKSTNGSTSSASKRATPSSS